MITDISGLRVGHWTDPAARTGCTVVLFPEGTVASGEVRGGAPATRETALLEPTRTVSRLDALLLTGGSAYGLAAADGVMRFCEERGMGVPTPAGVVPIVVGLGLFDLWVGDPSVRPGRAQGYAACEAATAGEVELGAVGAGAGATVGQTGSDDRGQGGLVSATARHGEVTVSALVAVNAAGIPGADDTSAPEVAAALERQTKRLVADPRPAAGTNTVVGLVATNARLNKVECFLVAQSAQDGLARAVFPSHMRSDGDAFVAAAVGEVAADVDGVRGLTIHAVAQAIRSLAGAHPPRPAGPERPMG
jgi:L-aminopeptidase/D-esterase-like protein